MTDGVVASGGVADGHGPLIAFDFGLKYIGVAIGQRLTGTSHGIKTVRASQGKPRWRDIQALIKEYQPKSAVIGQPLNMDGSVSDMAERAANFAEQLHQRTGLPVVMHDERLTSQQAKEFFAEAKAMGQAATEHELAACLILNSYMDSTS